MLDLCGDPRRHPPSANPRDVLKLDVIKALAMHRAAAACAGDPPMPLRGYVKHGGQAPFIYTWRQQPSPRPARPDRTYFLPNAFRMYASASLRSCSVVTVFCGGMMSLSVLNPSAM